MTDIELKEILINHNKWLKNDGGVRADLSGINLSRVDLHGANLCKAELCEADLSKADLSGTNFNEADLSGANLSRANLSEANLSGVDFSEADLSGVIFYRSILCGAVFHRAILCGANCQEANFCNTTFCETKLYKSNFYRANLCGTDFHGVNLGEVCFCEANLYGTNLYGANNIPYIPMVCPDTGAFIAWKKASGHIIKLLIPEDAKRSSATTRKCRANKAVVLAIENLDGTPSKISEIGSNYNSNFIYKIGETVEVEDFCEERFIECAAGIHFFMSRKEAVDY